MIPIRIQRLRAKGWQMPPNTIYVGRPTKWGNPFGQSQIAIGFPPIYIPHIIAHCWPLRCAPSLSLCLDLYTAWLKAKIEADRCFLDPLRGKNLACWCQLTTHCHADILLSLANPERNFTAPEARRPGLRIVGGGRGEAA